MNMFLVRDRATLPPPSHAMRNYGSLERFPSYTVTVPQKVLYALLVNEPNGFCAPSLVAIVGVPLDDIRAALETLLARRLVEPEKVPSELKISSDEYYFRITESRLKEAIQYLHNDGR